MNETVTVLIDALPYVLQGAAVTVTAVVGAMFLGLFIGVPLAVGQVYGRGPVRTLCGLYVWFFRGVPILVRETVGNVFGLGPAYLGMRRVVWAWPVGIAGNILLFTVFLGGVFHTPQDLDLYGQAGRQVMFLVVSVYGWWRWARRRRQAVAGNRRGCEHGSLLDKCRNGWMVNGATHRTCGGAAAAATTRRPRRPPARRPPPSPRG